MGSWLPRKQWKSWTCRSKCVLAGVLGKGHKKLGPIARRVFEKVIVPLGFTIMGSFKKLWRIVRRDFGKVIVPTFLGFLLGVVSSEYYYARSEREARHLANITRARPVPFVRRFPVIIEDGTDIKEMRTPKRYKHMSTRCPFSFLITEDGSINLRGGIYDGEGNRVVEGIGDSIRAIQPNKYDINSDDEAIEVVDCNEKPVFQLVVISFDNFIKQQAQQRSKFSAELEQRMGAMGKDVNTLIGKDVNTWWEEKVKQWVEANIEEVIRLYYITKEDEKEGDEWIVVNANGSRIVATLEEGEWPLTRLFCYPGYSHPGKRVQ